ncbi:hypothetical protein E9993_00350 [Labilibacter sediminis]|nr:hypothetical protein E9993_00350 [Labilibacter sediminis]
MRRFTFLMLIAAITIQGFAQKKQYQDITDFTYQTQNLDATNEGDAIKINVKSGEQGIITFNPKNKYWDLTQWVFFSIELENLTKEEVRFEPVLLYDNPRRKGKFKPVKNKHIGFLRNNENLEFNCVMIRDKVNTPDYPQATDFPQMKGMPGGVILNFDGIDAKHIKALKVIFPKQEFEREVIIKRLFKNHPGVPELYARNKEDFFPFINKYGQYKHAVWEGKITDGSQFAEAIIKEKKDIKAHPSSKEWNRFGGFANGPKFEATGNFRTQKINGKWWIIDPDGCLFWSTGVNGAGKLTVSTPLKGREHFFEGIPSKNKDNALLFSKNSYSHGLANLYRKYGEGSEEEYVATSLKRMKSWGLNTLGGWSAETVGEYPEELKLPYTVYINSVSPALNDKFPDVFDPLWKEDVERKIKAKAAFVKDDPFFFGFFINNEIHWGNPYSFANYTLAKGADCAGKKVFVELLQKRLNTIEKFNKLTGASFKSWNELLQTKVSNDKLRTSAIKTINEEHYTTMCEVYFKTTKALIDKYAPNKMYIGCRWHGTHKNKINTTVSAKYLDILSFNAYENEVEFYPYPHESIDKPFIVSEFNFGALDVGKFFTGLGYASSQRNRGEKYKNFVEGAMRNPRCVGAHWFMWANSTTAGRGNGENANCGLVSMTDQIYYELISYIRETTYRMYNYRTNK